MSLKNNLIKNGIANVIQKLLKVSEQVVIIPFFITAWGAHYYGEWITLTIIPSLIGLVDFGFGTASANKFVLKYVAGKKEEAAITLKTGLIVLTLLILATFFISSILFKILFSYSLIKVSILSTSKAYAIVMIMILAKLLNFYQQLSGAMLRSVRKASTDFTLSNIYSFINLTSTVILLWLGGDVYYLAWLNLILSLVYNPIYYLIGRTKCVLPSLRRIKITYLEIKQNITVGLRYMIVPAWQAVLFQGTTYIVSILVGPVGVTIFNTTRTLVRSVNQGFSIVNSSIFPELQYEMKNPDGERIKQLFVGTLFTTFVLAFIGSVFLGLFGLKFYQLWTKDILHPPITLWYFFVGTIIFNSLWWCSEIFFFAANKPHRITVSAMIISVLSIVVTFFSTKFWGLAGASIGPFFFEFVMFIVVTPVAFEMLGITNKVFKSTLKEVKNNLIKNFSHGK